MTNSTKIKRYQIIHSHDTMGGEYAGGPLNFLATDDLQEAIRYIKHVRSGEIIDTRTNNVFTGHDWEPLDEGLDEYYRQKGLYM